MPAWVKLEAICGHVGHCSPGLPWEASTCAELQTGSWGRQIQERSVDFPLGGLSQSLLAFCLVLTLVMLGSTEMTVYGSGVCKLSSLEAGRLL